MTAAADDLARIEAEIHEAAHFYMAHRGYEYPHPDAPDITMFQHTPGDPLCVACRAERNLKALVGIARAMEEIATKRLDETVDDHRSLARWHTEVHNIARAALARLNTKEGN